MEALLKSASLSVKFKTDENSKNEEIVIDTSKYDYGQLAEICYAIRDGVSIDKFKSILNPSLSPEQMRNIWYTNKTETNNSNTSIQNKEQDCINCYEHNNVQYVMGTNLMLSDLHKLIFNKDGNISNLGNTSYSSEQLKLISDCLNDGLNPIYMMNPAFDIEQMMAMDYAVRNGINPERWCHKSYTAGQMNCFNRADELDIDFSTIKNLANFNPDAMLQLIYEIHDGIDISCYNSTFIKGETIEGIREQRRLGYDLRDYATLDLNKEELSILAPHTANYNHNTLYHYLYTKGVYMYPNYRAELFNWIKHDIDLINFDLTKSCDNLALHRISLCGN